MQSLVEFSANQSCPEFAPETDSLYCSLSHSHASTDQLQRAQSYPLLSQLSGSLCDDSGHDLGNMTTEEDDAIEILSCHVEPLDDIPTISSRSAAMTIKLVDKLDENDPSNAHRKRVVRAVGVVTFLLLLFSVVLIGISLNMSKNIDEMVRGSLKNPRPNYAPRRENRTFYDS